MRSEIQTPDKFSLEDEKAELQAVLASNLFVRTPSLANLLSYLCRKYFQGQADLLKEYTIGVEAFGRAADFDKKEDSIVRVEIRRLREKLRQYYETEGADHSIRLTIPVGHYVPVFTKNESAPFQPCADAEEVAETRNFPYANHELESHSASPARVKGGSSARRAAEIWSPWQVDERTRQRRGRSPMAVARLKPGVTLEQAQADMSAEIGRAHV